MADNRFKKYAQPAQGTTFQTDPYASDEQRREEERLANERERLRLAQEAADRAAAKEALTLEEKRSEVARTEATQLSGMSDALNQLRNTIDAARQARNMGARGEGVGSFEGSQGFRDSAILSLVGANQSALDMEGLLNTIGSNTAFDRLQKMREESPTGGALGAVSEVELRLLRDSIGSLSQRQSEEQFQANLQKVIDSYTRVAAKLASAEQYMRQNGSMEGYTPPSEEALRNFSFDAPAGQDAALSPAGAGATEGAVEVPPEMQDEYRSYINRNWGAVDPQDLSRFMSGLEAKYNRPVQPLGPEGWSAFAERANAAAAEGQGPEVVGPLPASSRELSGGEQFLNDLVTSNIGTGTAAFANAATAGLPAALAGRERMQALQDINPEAAFVGDLAGGTLGALGTGAALGAVGRGSALLANPAVADTLYGTTYGALSADDPLLGAVIGAGSSIVGDQLGRQVGRGVAALRSPADPLSRGQRAIASSVGDVDEVAAQLAQAESLGVPMTLADASPELGSLAGSAVRFSPQTEALARQTMSQRNAGQLDRLSMAVERDLGPVQNIPQRSEDLLQQARAQAAPLYEQAYAAPGASSVKLDDLTARPTFRQALAEAAQEAADEGVDPTTLGFTFNEAGDVLLERAPSWQTLDYAKRGLDNIIERETDAINGISAAGRRAVEMKKNLVGRMDAINPAYAQARAAYAGPAAERAFLRQGEQAYNTRPDQLGVDVAGLTPEQQAQMRLGYQSEVMGRAGNLRNNSNPWAQLNTPNTEGRLGVLYEGAEDADIARLLGQRDLELQLAGSANRLTGNSATAGREVADQYFRQGPGMAGDVGMAMIETGALGAPFMTVGKGIADRMFRQRREQVAEAANRELADEIGPLLLTGTPTAQADNLTDIMQQDAAYQAILDEILRGSTLAGQRLGTGASVAAADYGAY